MNSIEFLRQFRLGEYAIFDFAVTFLVMVLLAPLLSKLFLKCKVHIPKQNWLFFAVPLSIVMHIAVGNMTPMTKNFLDIYDHYLLKISMFLLILLGLRGIELVQKPKKK